LKKRSGEQSQTQVTSNSKEEDTEFNDPLPSASFLHQRRGQKDQLKQ